MADTGRAYSSVERRATVRKYYRAPEEKPTSRTERSFSSSIVPTWQNTMRTFRALYIAVHVRDGKLIWLFTCARTMLSRVCRTTSSASRCCKRCGARTMSVELGSYKHCVGSLHLYSYRQVQTAESFLLEGWQSTKSAMPPMPGGDPSSAIHLLLKAEATVRRKSYNDSGQSPRGKINPYWADLIRLLRVFHYGRRRNKSTLILARKRQQWLPDLRHVHPENSSVASADFKRVNYCMMAARPSNK